MIDAFYNLFMIISIFFGMMMIGLFVVFIGKASSAFESEEETKRAGIFLVIMSVTFLFFSALTCACYRSNLEKYQECSKVLGENNEYCLQFVKVKEIK